MATEVVRERARRLSGPAARRVGRLDSSALAGALVREIEADAAQRGWATRRTGTSVTILRAETLNGDAPEGERRVANLEDVFVLLTGEEVA